MDSETAPVGGRSAVAGDLVTAAEVAKITGLSEKRVRKAAGLGYLTIWRPPPGVGGHAKYGRASAEALAASMVVPGRADASTANGAAGSHEA